MNSCFHDTAAAARFTDEKMNKVNLYESPHLFCDVYCLLPGQSQKAHSHAGNDKIYHVLSGRCTVQIGTDSRPLTAGHLAVAPAGEVHGVHNDTNEPATLLVVMAPNPTKQSRAES